MDLFELHIAKTASVRLNHHFLRTSLKHRWRHFYCRQFLCKPRLRDGMNLSHVRFGVSGHAGCSVVLYILREKRTSKVAAGPKPLSTQSKCSVQTVGGRVTPKTNPKPHRKTLEPRAAVHDLVIVFHHDWRNGSLRYVMTGSSAAAEVHAKVAYGLRALGLPVLECTTGLPPSHPCPVIAPSVLPL